MTVSKSLKFLTSQKLVQRSEHAIDTRAKTVLLTEQGKELVSKLVPIVEQVDAEFFDKLHKDEKHDIKQLLKKLNINSYE